MSIIISIIASIVTVSILVGATLLIDQALKLNNNK
jgi:hypothetical protein